MDNRCGWIALAGESPPRQRLERNLQADWLIIGGGITGLSAAHSLAARFPDQRIVLLDRQRVAQGASARNSGFAVSHELPAASELLGTPGFAGYQVASRIGVAAGQELRRRIHDLGIDCEFDEGGYHFAVHQPEHLRHAEAAIETLTAVGADARYLEGGALHTRLGSEFYARAIHCAGGNALLQPARYVRGLADSLPPNVEVFENSAVLDLQRNGGHWHARLEAGEVRATRVLGCVGAFLNRVGVHRSGTFPLELSASITRPLIEARWQSLFAERTWGVLSTLPGGATVRLLPGRRLLIRNTVEYRQADLDRAGLQRRQHEHVRGLQKRFPGLDARDLEYTWTGHLSGTRSGEPYFARVDQDFYAVSGCNGSGVARGTLWGRLLADMAIGASSPLLSDVLGQAHPGYLPPRPFFDVGAVARMAWEVRRARLER
ncbi:MULTISPECIES: NAD(P)/FAD-dependent oxidoreductase [unclassified Pseudomonas]|uniref:NAD(P)/FAD-dependent oxidoreductase n=1 Tax=unclassified Pseudomonas TaxID=196821 RepID=UPI0021C9021D|nr:MULTISPECIES: FAD-binding oxidoreductase [unclassified Pseudomonas]MCU1732307.1 FAD-binding oxidoreductase [Pseudomonas sp. 20P_3.2_Bac4]MCU1746680.1 FAD-binding oxidoreductase [Pseudomonas sp. 20P_3.2_Bac5]